MAQFPFLPLATDAYLGDTTHLTTVEHGAYLLLLITMWRNKGVLPNDAKMLARYAKCTPAQWKRLEPVVMPFFTVENDIIYQARLRDEFHMTKSKSRIQSRNARARWLNNNDLDDAAAMPNGCQTDAPTPTPTPTPTSKGSLAALAPQFSLSMEGQENPLQEAFDLFNSSATKNGWPKAQVLSETRKGHLINRLKDAGGLEGWRIALEKCEQSDFLNNRTKSEFINKLDFMLAPSNFIKIMEGNYDNRTSKPRKVSNAEKAIAEIQSIASEGEYEE